jgi:probable rRNA maturation factor
MRRRAVPAREVGRRSPVLATGAPLEVAVMIADATWRSLLPGVAFRVRRAALAAAAEAGGRVMGEIAVLLADDARISSLNKYFRGKSGATNVLAFPAAPLPPGAIGAPRLIGDVVLARETIAAEAAARGLALADHLGHLVVHGVLHLLGHDHETAAEAEVMEATEARALARLGIADPYADEAPAAAP